MATITYPTLVRTAPSEMELGLKSNTQVSTSDLSEEVQTVELPGARWTAMLRYPELERADADKLMAFLVSLRGQANRARVPVFSRRRPRGTWGGSPVVNNELGSPTLSQTGNALEVSGFTAFTSYEAGDLFNLGSGGQLLMVKTAGIADSGGRATLAVEPAIRSAPAHGTALVFNDPVIPLMILSDPHVRWSHKPAALSGFALDLIEVFS